MKNHQFYIRQCINLGKEAKSNGESPVGAILVKDGEIMASALEAGKAKKDITCHAEVEVIRKLREKLDIVDMSGYTMYTTHEPCILCSYAIRHHRISSVVWSISTGEIGGASSEYPILEANNIAVLGKAPELVKGILEMECKEELSK